MVDELGEPKDELRKWITFQTVTKLKNYITSTQTLGLVPVLVHF